MGGIKYYGCIVFLCAVAHNRQTTHVRNQIAIAKTRTALARHEVIGFQAQLRRCTAGFFNHVFHVGRREELTFFDVDRFARLRHRTDKIGLTTQKCGCLQHIDHTGNGFDLLGFVDIGQNRHTNLTTHFIENFQALIHAQAALGVARGAIGFIKRTFVNQGDGQFIAHGFECASGVDGHLQTLNRARTSD